MATKDWRDYFELVGLFAIVASIVLLAFEIHQTRLAIRGEAFLSRAVIGVEADMNTANSPYLPAIEIKYLTDGLDALSPVERERFLLAAVAAKTRMDAYFYQYELGLLDEEFYEFFLLPNITFYKKRWVELSMVNAGDTRPSFKALIDKSSDVPFWD